MQDFKDFYEDIANRTSGAIYVGIPGPVRTGKSTFINNFMRSLVIPNILDESEKTRANDQLPQSANGRTITTTEPKFIPEKPVHISLGENAAFWVRLIDCVGYPVKNAIGYLENGEQRMVITPWSEEAIPFVKAAEIGTRKVVSEHSTIAIVVTTDGSITDIDREDYIEAEEKVINELKALNKPFVVILNTINPSSERAKSTKAYIEGKFGITVMALNCKELTSSDINEVIKSVLFEFSLSEVTLSIPEWISDLPNDHWLKVSLKETILASIKGISKIKEIENIRNSIGENEHVKKVDTSAVNLGDGTVKIDITMLEDLFYKVINEVSGFSIENQGQIIDTLKELGEIKTKFDKIKYALEEVSRKGYGIVSPSIDELILDEPQIVKQGNKFGVKLKASAPSIHMIRADIETEVSPIVGTEKQSEELVHYLLQEFESDPKKIWQSNIFGKTLHELVNEGLHNKLYKMPEDAQFKLQETLQKILNQGSGGLICLIVG